MKLVIGLGNPGKEYEHTLHNVGFDTIDLLAEKWGISLNQQKFNAIYGTAHLPEGKVMVMKPLTYMNLSGEAVRPLMDYFDIELEDIVVIYDDLDLEKGKLRLRQKGSAGGHNGIKSLIQHLGTQNFNRIRIGIDRPPVGMKVVNYVLSHYQKEDLPTMEDAFKNAAEACNYWLTKPFVEVMNKFN
ncbi:aminoacyl-tRNA hydrolase [Rummeliibacillus stabekisii]|uniref:aminoacyl-tRNA hydrolase n=1 Tax=Rummeliibacillus stabekisii TaxID=241244 RepID=UPI00116C1CC9|nr:aminoacyl-tRNA hydrolase [Rummeliibacillus stabekisii]MBB5171814.1 PTH1 family peptidyl-tRNA hydrolase [Rummeliibacillus stabekisii]GEL06535.1 peptidyl-tRNA hydrolase [Rummeliibacillus stabekisii]